MLKPHYQKFAELYATGVDPGEAYQQSCGQGKSKAACYKGSQRLSKNVHILAEVERIRNEAQLLGGGAIADLAEVQRFLTKFIRDDSMQAVRRVLKPAKVDDEAQPELFEAEEVGPAAPEYELEVIYERVKPADRMKAAELLGKLQRWFAEDRKNDAEADEIDQLLDGV